MMIFNSFTVANDYNFGVEWPNGRGRGFFLSTNKTFKGICLALAGNFCNHSVKKRSLNLVLSLFMNKSTN